MDGVRKIANASYDKAALEERKKVMEFFDKLDSNGDGRISLEEYKKCVPAGWFSDDDSIFRQLDANGDGKLDFSDVVVLYYMGNMPNLFADQNADLLRSIRGKKEMEEEAVRWTDEGQYRQLVVAEAFQPSFDARREQAENREMKELSEIAQAHYRAAPQNVQSLANDFFRSMDTDGDGQIDLPEFLSFMREQGYPNMRNPNFFKVLDRDGSGTLEFSEVLTLYYIVKSGRPFCDTCGEFISGVFFSCVDCYKRRESSIYLCRDCYCSGKCKHNHNGRAQFLDNYTLLEVKRDEVQQLLVKSTVNANKQPTTSTQTQRAETVPSDATAPKTQTNNVYSQNNYYHTTHVMNPPNPCQAVAIPGSNKTSWLVALKAFEVGMNIGSVAATLCSIL